MKKPLLSRWESGARILVVAVQLGLTALMLFAQLGAIFGITIEKSLDSTIRMGATAIGAASVMLGNYLCLRTQDWRRRLGLLVIVISSISAFLTYEAEFGARAAEGPEARLHRLQATGAYQGLLDDLRSERNRKAGLLQEKLDLGPEFVTAKSRIDAQIVLVQDSIDSKQSSLVALEGTANQHDISSPMDSQNSDWVSPLRWALAVLTTAIGDLYAYALSSRFSSSSTPTQLTLSWPWRRHPRLSEEVAQYLRVAVEIGSPERLGGYRAVAVRLNVPPGIARGLRRRAVNQGFIFGRSLARRLPEPE